MTYASRNRWLFTLAALAGPAFAWASGTLEALLQQRRHDVSRWQVQPLAGKAAAASGGDIAQIGRIAARTAVRFADGRVQWYAVAGYREVLVSAHTVDAGAAVTGSDARLESRDVFALGCEPMARIDDAQRWRARRRLAAGEALCATNLEPAPEVERNRAVTLSARSGGIEVSRVLVALNDARAGERVRLRDASSGASLIGIVTGAGQARIPGEGR